MRACPLGKLLTLVVLLMTAVSQAKPHAETAVETPSEAEENIPVTDHQNVDNLSISPAPKARLSEDELEKKFDRATYFYPYRQALSAHVGTVFGFKDSTDDEDFMNYVGGFKYLIPSRAKLRWELGVDLLTLGNGHISVARRRIFNPTGAFRPYYGYGVTHKFVPDERFASFSNWENYLAALSVGFEDIRTPPRSIRLELEFLAGTEDMLGIFNIGYSFAW